MHFQNLPKEFDEKELQPQQNLNILFEIMCEKIHALLLIAKSKQTDRNLLDSQFCAGMIAATKAVKYDEV